MEKREAEGVAISTQVIRLKALSLIKASNREFKASDGWVCKFMKRNDLVLRVCTHISQNLPKDLEGFSVLKFKKLKKIVIVMKCQSK